MIDKKPCDFDGIRAVGEWVVCECVGERMETDGGIVLPETERIALWQTVSVGDKVTTIAVAVGDRLLFLNPDILWPQNGRRFACLHQSKVVAVLKMPEEGKWKMQLGEWQKPEPPRIIQATGNIQ